MSTLLRPKRTLPVWMKELVRGFLCSFSNIRINCWLFLSYCIDVFSIKECSVQIERLESTAYENQITDGNANENGNENVNTLNQIPQNDGQSTDAPVKRYRTRSSVLQSDSTTENGQIERKKSNSVSVPKPKPAFIEYKGKVEYFTEFHDIAFAADNLL